MPDSARAKEIGSLSQYRKLSERWLKLTVLLVVTLTSCHRVLAAGDQQGRRVLVLYERGVSYAAFALVDREIRDVLQKQSKYHIDFYLEYMDHNLFQGQESEQKLRNWYLDKYRDHKPDVIIAVGDVPIQFMVDVHDEYFSGIPVVFCGSAEQWVHDLKPGTEFTGSWIEQDSSGALDAALKLQPDTKQVLVVSGASPFDRALEDVIRRGMQDNQNRLQFTYLTGLPMSELLDRLRHIPENALVFYGVVSQDGTGEDLIPASQSLPMVLDAATAPVFTFSDSLVGQGAVGGYVNSFAAQGRVAAQDVLRILGGERPQDIPIVRGTNVYLFDWRALKRWGMKESNLPAGSVIEYKTPTVWELYRWRIVGAIAVIIAQFLLIIALLIHRKKRQLAEFSVREVTGRLLQSQDEERRRIARDLHDGTAQHLSGMALTIGQVLADFPAGYDRLRGLLQDSHVASREALNEVRTVSYVLHPPILDGLGLVPALRWYLDGLQKRTALIVTFEAPVEIAEITPDGERALFRIVQESINNVLRHSGGTEIYVTLSPAETAVNLEIRDNGHGMNVEELEKIEGAASLGVGIAGMRERVRQLHGTFKMSSSPRGTWVMVSLPRRKEQHDAHFASR